jgi:DNA mismatch repair protein MLH3
MEVISQLDEKFIVARIPSSHPIEDPSYLCIIDQHAADERIRVEELESLVIEFSSNSVLPGTQVTKTSIEERIICSTQSDPVLFRQLHVFSSVLKQWYWDIEFQCAVIGSKYRESDSNLFLEQAVLKGCPSVLDVQLSLDDLKQFVTQLTNTSIAAESQQVPSGVYRVINYKACRSAVMFGDYLDRNAMECMISKLMRCRLPFQCAHGRPSMSVLLTY